LTVTVSESMTVEDSNGTGRNVATSNNFTIASVARVAQRIATISTTETGLLSVAANLVTAVAATAFASGYAAGHFDEASVRYLRITNKDDTNFATLVFRSASGAEFAVRLDAGQSFLYACDESGGTVATMDASSTALTVTLENLADVTAQANTASVDLEVYAALV
jgi:hypothetical protein